MDGKESSSRGSLGLRGSLGFRGTLELRGSKCNSLLVLMVLKSKHGDKARRDLGGIIRHLCCLGGGSEEAESDSDDSIG